MLGLRCMNFGWKGIHLALNHTLFSAQLNMKSYLWGFSTLDSRLDCFCSNLNAAYCFKTKDLTSSQGHYFTWFSQLFLLSFFSWHKLNHLTLKPPSITTKINSYWVIAPKVSWRWIHTNGWWNQHIFMLTSLSPSPLSNHPDSYCIFFIFKEGERENIGPVN